MGAGGQAACQKYYGLWGFLLRSGPIVVSLSLEFKFGDFAYPDFHVGLLVQGAVASVDALLCWLWKMSYAETKNGPAIK